MRLLLIGATGTPYFEHCRQEIIDFLGSAKSLGFVSAANLFDEDAYFYAIQTQLIETARPISGQLVHIRWDSNWRDGLARVDAVLVGGGNTYALLGRLRQSGLLHDLREKVRNGLPYIGSSAGANIAGPNILTTNDWNVVGLTDFESLEFVPFNINPHYIEGTERGAPHSETRDLRIREYHQVRRNPVVAIEEKAALRVERGKARIVGKGNVKAFLCDAEDRVFKPGDELVLEDARDSAAGEREAQVKD
jgi:dipeptidase E